MNTIYRLIWNTSLGAWVVASELATPRRKSLRGRASTVRGAGAVSLLIGGSVLLAMTLPGAAQALPPLTVSTTVTENGVSRDSATTPALTVVPGGDYTGIGVTLTSQAPASGGNQAAAFVRGGHASFDSTSTITMQSTSAATVCCTYGIVADAGGTVETAATVSGSTGGAGAYGGSHITLNGGSLSGLFGIVSSGTGSLISGTADISGSGTGSGVRAELGGHVELLGGRVLSNGMTANGTGSAITATGVGITGPVTAQNGATVSLDGGSVTASGFGVFGASAVGATPSQVTTSADISVSGGGGGGAVSAQNGSRVDVVGGNLAGSIVASGAGSLVTFQDAVLTQGGAQGSVGVYAANGGQVNLNGGTVLAPFWNNVTVQVSGAGSLIRNDGAMIQGTPGSSVGARAQQGGMFILGAGGTIASSNTGVQALNAGIIESGGAISAVQTAAHASGAGSMVSVSGGSLTTTEYAATTAGIVADSGGVVNVSPYLSPGVGQFAGNGVLAQNGGTVNLAGAAFAVNADYAAALSISGAGSAINSSTNLTVSAQGTSGRAILLSNGANQSFTQLDANAYGSNGAAVYSAGVGNVLTVTGSSLSGTNVMEDDGNGMQLTAIGGSVLRGGLNAAASSLALSNGAAWSSSGEQSAIGTLALDGSYINVYYSDTPGTVQIRDGLVLGPAGGTIGTRGNDFTINGGTVTGTGDLIVSDAGTLTVTSGVDFTGDTFVSDAGGTLQIGNGGAIGTVALGQVHNDGALVLNRSDVVTVDHIDGTGRVAQAGTGTTVLSGDNTYVGQTSVESGTLQLGTGSTTGSVVGAVDIGRAGTLAVRRSNSVTFDNALTGSGVLDVDTQGEVFDFGANTGSAFAGTVALGRSTFQLGGFNAASLGNATLRAGVDSMVTVADGTQSLGGLSIQGGTLRFNASVPDQQVGISNIKVGLLDASGTGTIVVNVPAPYTLSAPDTPNATNLLAQDDGNIGTRLVDAGSVVGSGGALALVDQGGNVLSDGRSVDIAQDGNVVARADYDFRLTTAPGDGLYVNYGLTTLDLVEGQTLTLAPDRGADATARAAAVAVTPASDMSARITGLGNLAIEAGVGVVSLSNASNDYSGVTAVNSGALRLDADNALGNTKVLALVGGTSAQINGTSQSIGAIDVQSGATLDVGGGSLTLADGGRAAGALGGAGTVSVNGGALVVQGANAGLSASIGIANGATVQLDSAAGLGSGDIANEGLLAFGGASDDVAFSNALRGTGTVALDDQSDLVVKGDNSGYAGTFAIGGGARLTAADARNLGTAAIIDDGDLLIDTASDWVLANAVSGAGNVTKQGAGVLSVVEGLAYTGTTTVSEGVLRAGQATAFSQGSLHTVSAGATLDSAGFSQSVAGLTNAGVVNLASDHAGSTLTVAGNYVGNGGRLVLGTALGGDDSATDRLVVQGDTAGNTRVSVVNMGGAGSATDNGIKVVEVGGASNGTFALEGRVVAGAYEYALKQGGKLTPSDGNWYLRSEADDIVGPVLRPEPAAYLGNQQAAVRMFRQGLHDRAGEPGLGAAADDGHGISSWVRVQSNQLSASTSANQVDTDTRADTFQVGGDLQFNAGSNGRLHLGVMVGHGRATTDGISQVTGNASQGRVDGDSVGLYGTWYQNAASGTGLYVDGWAQYARFDNTVQGDSLAREAYRSHTVTGSLEAGYATRLHTSKRGVGVYLEPQLQVIHTDFNSDDVTEQNGTVVERMTAGGTTSRVGARLYTRPMERDHNRVQPFVAVNWWSGGNAAGVAMDGEYLQRDLPKDVFEAKAGAQFELGRGWSGWGQISRQSGSYGFRDVSAQMGVKLNW
ncbi:autotransporter outer membrane beta-barrel domain-containing protein [Stenotrophomonas sp. PD6]|uniref:autotransporter outer membrane beta-barrel domain-containing protein n=1 Tax=Stenotrophomonas sp. PD6 TaxID=3368612 RepID=UPI003B9E85DD